MDRNQGFDPKWDSPHPGESFTDCLEEYSLSVKDVAQRWDIPLDDLRALQRGEKKIDDRMATAFSKAFVPVWEGARVAKGSEAGRKSFWLRLQALYDAGQDKLVKMSHRL
jgi:plasmid maintenance system antidote protein VapI